MTINSETQASCWVGSVRICTDFGESAKINLLMMQKDILGCDLMLRYNAIKAWGSVFIT